MRTEILIAALAVCFERASHAQSPAYTFGAEASANDDFGYAVAGAGDVDADGFEDVAVGSPRDDHNGTNAGAVRVYSGRTGALLRTWYGEQTGSLFGWSLDGLGDIDGDGHSDVIVGAPIYDTSSTYPNSGEALVISGATGSVLRRQIVYQWGAQTGDEVRGLGDIDGDGRGDYALGLPHYDTTSYVDAGRILIYSGATHVLLGSKSGTATGDLFGYALDVVQSGPTPAATRIAVGVPGYGATDQGRVYVVDGNAQYLIQEDGAFANGQLGTSVAGVGDLDGDGFNDVAAGEPYADIGGTDTGRVAVFSVGTWPHALIKIYAGSTSNELLGSELARVGDFDGDGVDDLALGMPYADVSGADSGRAIVVSAASGVQLANWYGGPGDHFGRSVEGVDINSDGEPDIVIGAPEAPSGAGQAFVRLLRAPAPSSYCTAKTNSLGCVAAIQYLGTASLSVVDNFHVYGVNIFNQKNGLLFWGLAPTASPFHGGTLCVQQPIRRTALQSSGGASGPHDCTGQFDFFFSHAYMQSQGIPAGSIVRAQYWYRDPGFASPNNFAMTNGLAITIAP